MSDFIGPNSQDEQQQIKSLSVPEEGVIENADPLFLDIPDEELVKIIDQSKETNDAFYEKNYNLTSRRKKNKTYLLGRQLDDKEKNKEFKNYEARSLNNVLYEIETSLKPLAMSHLPDMIVLPGSEEPDKQKTATDLTIAINDTNKKRSQRKALALGFKHLPAYFTACIKAVWDPSIGKNGDFKFINVHPNFIVADHNAKTNDADEMEVVIETFPTTVQELFMRFPAKINELKEELKKDGVNLDDKQEWKDLATEVNGQEVWFTWYKKKDTKDLIKDPTLTVYEPGVKWEKVEGVIWKYNNVILDKMLNPNFDHVGEDAYFVQDDPNDPTTKHELSPEEMLMLMMSGNYQGIQKEKIYHNYFDKPRKPYFFFGYDQWGEIPYDETSRIEQNIRNQEILDDIGKRIIDKLKQRVKHFWSKESGLKSEDVQKMDMENPNLDALVEGDLAKVHKSIDPERPNAAEYKSKQDLKGDMYAVAHASAIRGDLQSDVATTNQIGREADFTTTDDLVEETINAACEWMAEWQMQFIKLRYTEDHMKQILGASGSSTFLRLRRDMISDGMEVTVKASSTDKLKAQRNALETAKLGPPYTNPVDFFKDMDMNDPEGRTERGMMMTADPAGFYAKYVLKLDGTQQLTQALGAAPLPQPGMAPMGAQPMAPSAPANPTPVNTANVAAQPPLGVPASPSNGML
jgi:molybdopterin converting factor small subunit